MRIARIVNAIPQDHSNETNSDSEPNIAVNPNNPQEMVITAFTHPDTGKSNGPLYFSTDGGENWSLRFDVPGGMPNDQTVSFASNSNELYMAILEDGGVQLDVLRTVYPPAAGTLPKLETRASTDQPWVNAISVTSGPDAGKDRIYIGYGDTSSGYTAAVDICFDALAANPTFTQVQLDTRTAIQDGFHIRPKPHPDGTVYAGYQSWQSSDSSNVVTMNMVVARDDNWGHNSFGDLKDKNDGKAGTIVASVKIDEGATLGGQRADNGFDIQVDPNNSDIVYICWVDNSGPNLTLRVRRSVNRGADWSGDLFTVDNAALSTMAINIQGTVALSYLQLVNGKWETHFRTTSDGTHWDDLLLARTATSGFIGDYMRMVAVYNDFYGVFPAMNTPDPANFFPNGGGTYHFQRNTQGSELVGTDNTTVITPSLDPFFFKVIERDLTIITDRNTFGKDEVDALIHLEGSPGSVKAAFYITIDGFSANDLGITNASFVGTPDVTPSISFDVNLTGMLVKATTLSAPDETNSDVPQRFTWTYEVDFTSDVDFTAEIVSVTMTASKTSNGGIQVTGQAVFTLTTQPNPYETDGPTSWLSVDLQVFNILEGGHLPSTPDIVLNAGPVKFIQDLLANSAGAYNDPNLARAPNHPYDLDLVANQANSVVEIAQKIGQTNVYNFAVARVRYRALSTSAPNVRTFFRMFQASTTSTDYQPTTYATGGMGGSEVPLLGVVNGEVVTIPFFASDRVDPTNANGLNAQPDPTNVGPVGEDIPPDASGKEVQVYFGCWLDINQTNAVLPDPNSTATAVGPYTPVQSIQQAIKGKHQCLVAEIKLDPPEPQIANGASPANSDKLAQRNLNIVGVASPHQVPVTFDIKPTQPSLPAGQPPDELMIDWGHLPGGSTGNIYLPGIDANKILRMADRMYTRHGLSSSDAHTLSCKASGITYVPIPTGTGSNYAGLLTVNLPDNVKGHHGFQVIARQVTNEFSKRPSHPPLPPIIEARQIELDAKLRELIEWRRVLGSFQVTIPVETKQELLAPEERLLSVLKFIREGIPHHNRWYPVFLRYLKQIAGRVTLLGGDPNKILPSPTGNGRRPGGPLHKHPGHQLCYTGKVSGLVFDRFGDFEGFLLDSDEGERAFTSREREIEELAEYAWRERLRITVCVDHHNPDRPRSIIVREPPVPFK